MSTYRGPRRSFCLYARPLPGIGSLFILGPRPFESELLSRAAELLVSRRPNLIRLLTLGSLQLVIALNSASIRFWQARQLSPQSSSPTPRNTWSDITKAEPRT